jgi:hypothetical protein
MAELRLKRYPDNYASRVVAILEAMSLNGHMTIVGSSSVRSMMYAADYDGYEVVTISGKSREAALREFAGRFQSSVRELKRMDDVWIGDIKIGVIDAWRVIPVSGDWDVTAAREKVKQLRSAGIITADESREALGLLAKATTKAAKISAREGIKFHVLRWTPREVLDGQKRMRDGRYIQLAEAMGTPGLIKMDVIAWLGAEGYTDFSVIYELRSGRRVLNPVDIDVVRSLHESLLFYIYDRNYFKALKRLYSIARHEKDVPRVAKLGAVLNSDLGRLYQVVSDIETLLTLLEEHGGADARDVAEELDGFVTRLSHIWELSDYLRAEPGILAEIRRIIGLPLKQMAAPLTALGKRLDTILQTDSKPIVETYVPRHR